MYNYDTSQFDISKGSDLIRCDCDQCKKSFYRKKLYIIWDIKRNKHNFVCTGCKHKNTKNNTRKECKNCKSVFYDHSKIFCSQSCAATYNNLKKEKKLKQLPTCLSCSKPLKRKNCKYCDNYCRANYKRKEKYALIESDTNHDLNVELDARSTYYKQFLIEKRSPKCEECGWSKINPHTGKIPIELEHIDGNCLNNKINNLKLLCPSCHSLTATYKGSNKGKGSARYNLWKTRFK
jgi:hypothetical protein